MKNFELQFGLLRVRLLCEPDNADLYSQLLLLSELQGDYTACCALYLELIDSFPYAHLAWYHLGLTYRQLDDPSAALEALEYAFLANPMFEEGYYTYAELSLETGNALAALRGLEALLEQQQHADCRCLIRMSEAHIHLNNTPAAVAGLQRALQLEPHNAEAQYFLGVCFAAEQDYPAAARCLRLAVRAESRREDFHQALAEVYGFLGKDRLARQHYWRAIDLSPDEPIAWVKFAAYLLHHGDPDAAMEVLEQALENTCGPQLDYCLAACLFLLNRREEALRMLRAALAEDRSRLDEFFSLAPELSADADVRMAIEER